jgi:hypothetical protein
MDVRNGDSFTFTRRSHLGRVALARESAIDAGELFVLSDRQPGFLKLREIDNIYLAVRDD